MDLSCEPNLMTEHSSSIRNPEETIQLLKRKMKNQLQKMKKQLQKMKKKINKTHCCHHTATNCNNVAATSATTNVVTSLNSDLLANICKSAIELVLDNRKEVFPKKGDHKSGRSTKPKKTRKYNTKKVKLKRLNNLKGEFSWKVEHLHKTVSLQDIQDTTDIQDVVPTNCENISPVINQLSITETTTNQSDLSDKIFSVHSTEVEPVADVESVAKVKPVTEIESVAEVQSVVDNPTILHTSTNETDMSVSPNADNVESVDTSYTATEMTLSPSYSESSINRPNDDIVNIITTKNRSQNKKKSVNPLMKNLRNLKRKMNSDVRSNKRLKIEICSNNSSEFQPVKKRRIAHTSKTPTSQSDCEKNSIRHRMGRIVESQVCVNPSANIQTSKDGTSVENQTDCTMSDEHVINNSVKSTSTHRFIKKPSIKNNLFFTKTEDSFDKNNISSLVNSIEQSSSVSAALGFVDSNVLIDSNTINNGTTSTEETTIRIFNNCGESEVSHNILPNTTNNEESNRYASSNVSCEDSRNYKLTEDIHENTVEATCNTLPRVTSHHLVSTLKFPTNKSYNYERDVEKDTHTEISERRVTESPTSDTQIQDHLPVNSEGNCAISKDKQSTVDHIGTQDVDRTSVMEEDLHSPLLKRRNIIKNHINDNKTRKSHDEINIETEKKETCVNNEGTEILDLEMSERIEKSIEVIYVDNNGDDDNFENDVEQVSDIRDNDTNNDIKADDIKDNDDDTNDIKNDGDMNNDIKNDVANDNNGDTNNYIRSDCDKDNDSDANDTKSDHDENKDSDANNIKNDDVKDNDNDMNSDIRNVDVKDDDDDNVNNEDKNVGKILTPKGQICKYISNNIKRGVKKLTYKTKKRARRTIEYAGK